MSIELSEQTHRVLSDLAAARDVTISDTVAVAVRRLIQVHMGQGLAARLTAEEVAWLDADLI